MKKELHYLTIVFIAANLLLFLSNETKAQTIIYVDSSIAKAGTGNSWTLAYKNLTRALTRANADTGNYIIRVAKGTYYPATYSGNTTTNRDSSFRILRNGIQLQGGFKNGSNTRNIADYPTVLSGDIGTKGDSTDNSYHILTIVASPSATSIDGNTIINGFTLIHGNANGTDSFYINSQGIARNNGAGVYNYAYTTTFSPTFSNCTFQDNSTTQFGGGMYNGGYLYIFPGLTYRYSSNPSLSVCTFKNNHASDGGAMYNNGEGYDSDGVGSFAGVGNCTPVLAKVSFNNNVAYKSGGAVYNDASHNGACTLTLNSCSFYNNVSDSSGGAITDYAYFDTFGAQCIADNCFFIGNSSIDGGAFYSYSNDDNGSSFSDCIFDHNMSSGNGGALFISSSLPWGTYYAVEISNCSFTDNHSSLNGGAIAYYLYNSGAQQSFEQDIINTTFYNNGSNEKGNTIYYFEDEPSFYIKMYNSIIYENKSFTAKDTTALIAEGSFFNLNNTLLQGTAPKSVILDSVSKILRNRNPQFTDTTNLIGKDGKWATHDDGLELKTASIAFNKGLSTTGFFGLPPYDITGAARVQCDTVDLGAYEVACIGLAPPLLTNTNSLERNIVLFPNPALSTFTLQRVAAFKQLSIFDMSGKIILQQTVSGNSATINIASLPQGIYMVNLQNSQGSKTLKLVKE